MFAKNATAQSKSSGQWHRFEKKQGPEIGTKRTADLKWTIVPNEDIFGHLEWDAFLKGSDYTVRFYGGTALYVTSKSGEPSSGLCSAQKS